MPSPFPGMNPYLEVGGLWPDFQHQFAAALYQLLLPGLVDRYRPRVSNRKYGTEMVLFTSIVREEHSEPLIEIRGRGESKLITLVEIVSPANRTTAAGRAAYLTTRREAICAGASVVEIDLVLDGRPMLDFDRSAVPLCDYSVTVTRSTQTDRPEFYPLVLAKPLPRFRLPLAADHRDLVLDLQAVFDRTYEQGQFDKRMDYSSDPAVPLDDSNRQWLYDLFKRQKLR